MLKVRATQFRNRPISKPPTSDDLIAALARERRQSARWRRGAVDDDVFQEVSLRAFKGSRRFVGSDLDALTGWVSVIHTRVLIDAHRKRKRRRKTVREVPLISNGGTWEPRTRGSEELAAANAIFSDIETQVAKLPQARADAARLILFKHRTERETAEILGVPLGTASSRVAVAKRDLRLALPEYAPLPSPKTPSETPPRRRGIRKKRKRKFDVTEFNIAGRAAHEAERKTATTDWARF